MFYCFCIIEYMLFNKKIFVGFIMRKVYEYYFCAVSLYTLDWSCILWQTFCKQRGYFNSSLAQGGRDKHIKMMPVVFTALPSLIMNYKHGQGLICMLLTECTSSLSCALCSLFTLYTTMKQQPWFRTHVVCLLPVSGCSTYIPIWW